MRAKVLYSIYPNMHNFRLLGLAIRAPWLGFAEIDARKRLLDWGMIFYQRRAASEIRSAKKRLDALVARANPTFVVLSLSGLKANGRVASVRSITRSLRAAARSRSIQVVPLHRTAIRAAFAPCRARSKYQIAVALARAFPELRWKLPPEPKIWAKEDSKMALFDALAGAIAYRNCKPASASCGKADPVFD